METTGDFIRRIKQNCGVKSDYAVAKLLNISRFTMSAHATGRASTFSDETALKVAELLGEQPGYVLACMHSERAKEPTLKTAWRKIADAARAAALGVTFAAAAGLVTLAAPAPAHANTESATFCILCKIRRWWAAVRCWLSALRAAPCSAL